MTIKSLKKFTALLNRNEGGSIVPIIVLLVIMSIMGGVFTSIMNKWKESAPMTINSSKAFFLAESAAMSALQDANYRFFSKNTSGTPDFPDGPTSAKRDAPYFVVSNDTETAEYWIERPWKSENDDIDGKSANSARGNNDDGTSREDDDIVDDDGDDDGTSKASGPDTRRYTIIATGKVKNGSYTVAKRQVKVKASIIRSNGSAITPGVHTEGIIHGSGPVNNPHFHMTNGPLETSFANGDDTNVADPDLEAGIVYRNPPPMDPNMFKALSTSQGHNQTGPWPATDGYPNGSYYYDTPTNTMPNVTYIDGNMTASGGQKQIYGVFYVTGSVTLNGNAEVNGIIICEGNITLNGGAGDEINGGIIQYGVLNTLEGNGNNVDITVNGAFFDALSVTMPIITVESWQETVSAN